MRAGTVVLGLGLATLTAQGGASNFDHVRGRVPNGAHERAYTGP
jgi:hypothetical protein